MNVVLFLGLAWAQEVEPPTIRAVTVFPDRASVTRVVGVTLAPGLNEVKFVDLPPSADERSLQAEGLAAGARILGLDVRSRELVEDRRARVAEIETRIETLRDELTVARDRDAAATTELTFLQKVGAEAAKQLSAELLFADGTPKDAESMAALLRARIPEVQATGREARIAARDLEVSIAALERELATVRGAAQWSRKDVTVLVEATAEAAGEVTLTYVVPGAAWTPAYDARAEVGEAATIALTLNALIVQTTGEDWADAALSLSTARPSGGVQPPELAPFWLESSYSYAYPGSYDGAEDDMMSMDSDSRGDREEAAPPPPPPPMAVATATITERAVATTFEVAGAATVLGDGTRRKVRVTDVTVTGSFVHVVVPRLEPAAYLVAEAKWENEWPLLAGDVSTFLDGAFTGIGHLDTTGKGGELALGFGRDDALAVDVEIVTDRLAEKGSKGIATREWTYRVTSGRDTPVNVEVRDRVPQTRDAKFKVEALGDEPDEVGPEGAVTWHRPLAADGEAAIAFGYEIRYPRKHPPGVLP